MEKFLYILRHGETEHNRLGIVQGRGVDSILNQTGIQQADSFYKSYAHIPFDMVVCSSQTRSYETISLFEQAGHAIHRDERIDEICWGEHEGKSGEPFLMEKYYRIIQSWADGNYHDKPVGGESAHDLSVRLQSFISDLHHRPFSNALVCTHGRTLRAMICLLFDRPLSEMDQIPHRNTGLYLLHYKNEGWNLLRENDCSHLSKMVLV